MTFECIGNDLSIEITSFQAFKNYGIIYYVSLTPFKPSNINTFRSLENFTMRN